MSKEKWICYHLKESPNVFEGKKTRYIDRFETKKYLRCNEDVCTYCEFHHELHCDMLDYDISKKRNQYKVYSSETQIPNWGCRAMHINNVSTC